MTESTNRPPGPSSSRRGGAGDPLRVAIDVQRLFHSLRLRMGALGITRYTRALVRRLGERPDVEVVPVVYGDWDSRDAATHAFVERLEQEVGPVTFLWHGSAPLVGVDVYLSPIYQLPPPTLTGSAARVVVVHDLLHLKFPEYFPGDETEPAIAKTLRSIDRQRDWVICVSARTERDVRSHVPIGRDRISVVPEAPDEVFFDPDPAEARRTLSSFGFEPQKYLLLLGQTEPRKNLSRLMQAVRRVFQNDANDQKLLVVAFAASHDEVADALSAEGLPPERCGIVTDVDDPTLASLYSQASGLLYAPLYEGFGLPPLEAMAGGCVSIVSPVGAVLEVVGDAGLYVDPRSVNSIAEGIQILLARPRLRERLRTRGRERAERFRWDRTIDATVKVLRRASRERTEGSRRQGTTPRVPAIRYEDIAPSGALSGQLGRGSRLRRATALLSAMASWCLNWTGLAMLASIAGFTYASLGLRGAPAAAASSAALTLLLVVYVSIRARHQTEQMALRVSKHLSTLLAAERERQPARPDDVMEAIAQLRKDLTASIDQVEEAAVRYADASKPGWHATLAAIDEVQAQVEKAMAGAETRLRHEIAEVARSATARLGTERAMRLSDLARGASPVENPGKLLLLFSLHRSGSTWLFDLLRSHPGIYVEPTARYFEALSLDGRRYPVGLSNAGGPRDIPIEVHPGLGAKIPALSLPESLIEQGKSLRLDPVAVEKLHASFVAFEADTFLQHVAEFEKSTGIPVELIYQVRSPRSAIVSVLRYRQRDPTWYPQLAEDGVPAFMRKSLETLVAVAERRPGLLVEYERLRADPLSQLARIYAQLWPSTGRADHASFATSAIELTARESVLEHQARPFLGQQTSEAAEEGGGVVLADTDDLAACSDLLDMLHTLARTES